MDDEETYHVAHKVKLPQVHLRNILTADELIARWPGMSPLEVRKIIPQSLTPYKHLKKHKHPDGGFVHVCAKGVQMPSVARSLMDSPLHKIAFDLAEVIAYESDHRECTWPVAPEVVIHKPEDKQPSSPPPREERSATPAKEYREEKDATPAKKPREEKSAAPAKKPRGEITQQSMADRCGVSLRTVQKWEKGVSTPSKYPGRAHGAASIAWAVGYKQNKALLADARAKNRAMTMDSRDIDAKDHENAFD